MKPNNIIYFIYNIRVEHHESPLYASLCENISLKSLEAFFQGEFLCTVGTIFVHLFFRIYQNNNRLQIKFG